MLHNSVLSAAALFAQFFQATQRSIAKSTRRPVRAHHVLALGNSGCVTADKSPVERPSRRRRDPKRFLCAVMTLPSEWAFHCRETGKSICLWWSGSLSSNFGAPIDEGSRLPGFGLNMCPAFAQQWREASPTSSSFFGDGATRPRFLSAAHRVQL